MDVILESAGNFYTFFPKKSGFEYAGKWIMGTPCTLIFRTNMN
jgi:hypothetical protein